MKTYLIHSNLNTINWVEEDYMDYDLWSEFRVHYSQAFEIKTKKEFIPWLFKNGVKRIPEFGLYLTLRGSRYDEAGENTSRIDSIELRAVNKSEYQMMAPDETDKLVASYHLPAELNVLFGEFMKEVHGLPLRCEGDDIERFMEQYLALFANDTILTIESAAPNDEA